MVDLIRAGVLTEAQALKVAAAMQRWIYRLRLYRRSAQ